jgi:threonine synthase
MKYVLECVLCGEKHPNSYKKQVCSKCGGILEVVYIEKAPRIKGLGRFWDYESVLPECNYKHYELGSTRLIRSHDQSNVFLKLETDNPTRSFKDRGSIIEVSKALEYQKREIAVASTGNMAYSIAYYAKLAGLQVKTFISIGANKNKIKDIRSEGDARMDFVSGDFTKAQRLAERYARKSGAFLAGDYCYRKEGQKTTAYEIMDQMPGVTHIVVPVGNATLISGIFKALGEMQASGRIRRLPKLIAVQSKGSDPLITAFNENRKIRYTEPKTKADAIAVGFPTFGDEAIEALRATHGKAISVSDEELELEKKAFYENYGIIAELAGVAGIAAIKKMRFGSNAKVVSIVSGGNV